MIEKNEQSLRSCGILEKVSTFVLLKSQQESGKRMMKKKIPEEITNENFPNATKDKPRDSRISAPIEYTQRNNAQIIR